MAGWSKPVAHKSATLHLKVRRKSAQHRKQPFEKLPGETGLVVVEGREASLDFSGFNTLVLSKLDFANKLSQGHVLPLPPSNIF